MMANEHYVGLILLVAAVLTTACETEQTPILQQSAQACNESLAAQPVVQSVWFSRTEGV